MTTSTAVRGAPTTGAVAPQDALAGCLAASLDLAGAADALGLDGDRLRAIHADAVRRLGFPGETWVLALVGGTGVGKSTLLNAIAGSAVSQASARRPTTAEPIAWVPSSTRSELAPLLDWLGVRVVREHAGGAFRSVAILDLPDMDSLAREHRRRVEELLPKVDAVAWVTDPEKYHDAVLHDDFLREWVPRLSRQVIVVNKADRIGDEAVRQVRDDLTARLDTGSRVVPVLSTTATTADGSGELRAWIDAGIAAKAIVRDRVTASLVAAAGDLLRQAGLEADREPAPLLTDARRTAATRDATMALLAAVDVAGLEAQAVAATRASARARGTGPIGTLTSLAYRASGREAQVADPGGYLMRWRDRGSVTPAIEAIRAAQAEPLRSVSPALRPAVAAAMDPEPLRRGLQRAVDRAILATGELEAPRSRWWRLAGLLQTLTTVGLALSAAWVVAWILVRPETGSVALPLLGAIPTPLVALLGFGLAGFVLARALGAHAAWVGRRWAGQVRDRVEAAVAAEVRDHAFRAIDDLGAARGRLSSLARSIGRDCGR